MEKSNNGNVNTNSLDVSSNYDNSSKANEKLRSRRVADEKAILNLKSRIPDIDNIFDIHGRIGNGTFSTVLLASLKRQNNIPMEQRKLFAIKHLIPTSHPKRIQKELKCLIDIGGVDNVAGIDLCLRRNESVAFVMPFIAHDRFHDYFNKMDTNEIQKYIKNLLIALKRVHSFNIIHRDVKPSNFLYNRKLNKFMLVDFGLAQNVYGTIDDEITTTTSSTTTSTIKKSINNDVEKRDQKSITTEKNYNDGNNDNLNGCRKRKVNEIYMNSINDQLEYESIQNSTKRIKESSTENHHGIRNTSTSVGSAIITNSPQFKMPLKQLNENPIVGIIKSNISSSINCNNKLNSPLTSNIKSAILGVTMTPKLEEKFRITTRRSPFHQNTSAATVNARLRQQQHQQQQRKINNKSSVNSSSIQVTPNKYNNNNNSTLLSSSSSSYRQYEQKCYCYGKNQVCNMCIIRKDIPASRAGTPGYRPPEVLLKYVEQNTSVDIWAVGVILISILSGVYPFFQAPDDFIALAEIVTIFGDDIMRNTAYQLGRQLTMSRKCKPLDLKKLCIRLRNRFKLNRNDETVIKNYQKKFNNKNNNKNFIIEECSNCQQKSYDCLCANSSYITETIGDDKFPSSLYNLLERLLEVNPYKRITAEEALNHQFFKEIY